MEVYSLGLYLVAQFYLREAHKADTADTWPTELFSMQQEPSSPMHMTAKAWGRDAGGRAGGRARAQERLGCWRAPALRNWLWIAVQRWPARDGWGGPLARSGGWAA